MTEERIPPNPLEPGDQFKVDVEVHEGYDRVLVDVPSGSGLTFAVWLHRILTETAELRAARHAADLLAELKAAA